MPDAIHALTHVTPFYRYHSTSVTAAVDTTGTAEAVIARANTTILRSTYDALFSPAGIPEHHRLDGALGIELEPFGVGAEDDTFLIDVEFGYIKENTFGQSPQVGYPCISFKLVDVVTCTLGEGIGVALGVQTATDRGCKVVNGAGTALHGVYVSASTLKAFAESGDDSVDAYSGCFRIPNVDGAYCYRLRIYTFTGTDEANCFVRKLTT